MFTSKPETPRLSGYCTNGRDHDQCDYDLIRKKCLEAQKKCNSSALIKGRQGHG